MILSGLRVALLLGALFPLAAVSCTSIDITDAWIREPPPSSNVAAGYFNAINFGSEEQMITSIKSSCCASVAMHKTSIADDRATMLHLDTLTIAPGEKVNFAPNGAHLMLVGPLVPLRSSERVEISFNCRDGTSSEIDFKVQRDH
ncbi:MAG: copper(I)-binding protein [Gammaproteobacteria bacterium]